MAIHDAGMFTVKKTNRLKILQDVIDRNLRPGQAAEMLSITPRHCSRLLKRYRQLGPLGMNNHSRGRVGNRLLPTSLIDQALCIIREHYRDFGPTLALENLEEVHGLVLGKETIRRLMIKAGIWIPCRQRAPKIHQPRYRRPCTGALIQIDGCDHHCIQEQFKKKLRERLENPRVPASQLHGRKDQYKIKLRGAGYRLVYSVEDEIITVTVIGVGKRENDAVYKVTRHRS